MAENHDELERFGGEPAPTITKEEFDNLPQPENIRIADVMMEEEKEKPKGTPLSRLKKSINNVLENRRVTDRYRDHWKPGDEYTKTDYQGENQEKLNDYEYTLAEDFLKKLYHYQKSWPADKKGNPPGKKNPEYGQKLTSEKATADVGQAWGVDFLRKEYGDEVVDVYFKNLRARAGSPYPIFYPEEMEAGDNDKNFLADYLFSEESLGSRFGTYTIKDSHHERINELKKKDIDIFNKQFIYFLRFVEGTEGKQIQPPIVEKLKREEN